MAVPGCKCTAASGPARGAQDFAIAGHVGKKAEVDAVKDQWGAEPLGQATLILRKGSYQAGSPSRTLRPPTLLLSNFRSKVNQAHGVMLSRNRQINLCTASTRVAASTGLGMKSSASMAMPSAWV